MRPLRELARELCSVLLVAHNRKMEGNSGDEIADANGFTSSVDGWASIQKKDILPDGSLRLTFQKDGRALRGTETVIMDTHTLRFRSASPEEVAAQNQQSDAQKRETQNREKYRAVAEVLARYNGKATATQLADNLNMTQTTFSRLQTEMKEDRHLRDTGETFRIEGGSGRGAALLTVPGDSPFYSFMQNSTGDGVNEWNDDETEVESEQEAELCPPVYPMKAPGCFSHL